MSRSSDFKCLCSTNDVRCVESASHVNLSWSAVDADLCNFGDLRCPIVLSELASLSTSATQVSQARAIVPRRCSLSLPRVTVY
jgi:hypothetical protein